MKFFVPYLQDAPEAAEAEWQRYLQDVSAPADSQRVYSVTHHQEGSKIIATVGEEQLVYTPRCGPRGGYVKNSGPNPVGRRTGTEISAIIDAGHDLIYVIYVWIYGAPFGEWANPSLIGRSGVEDIEYFETPQVAAPHIRLDLRVSDNDPYGLSAKRNG
ncbi:MAG: hypothetical protein ACXW1Y_02575 [Acidimicrobiia bacterium]